jgi:uncharacterized RDD family membrane protein YckC
VSRGLAVVVDVLCVLTVTAFAYLGVVLTRLIVNPRRFAWPELGLFFSVTGFIVISIAYLALWWGTSGRTVGCAVLGLRLIATRGRLRWPVAILRAVLCTFFPVGLLWVVFDHQRRRSLQDIVFRTIVVYDGQTVYDAPVGATGETR